MVAQNGIYIKNINNSDYAEYWEESSLPLLTLPSDARAFKLDFDSLKGVPYIEFPADISNTIGDGIEIKYIVTSGTRGNIDSKILNKIGVVT